MQLRSMICCAALTACGGAVVSVGDEPLSSTSSGSSASSSGTSTDREPVSSSDSGAAPPASSVVDAGPACSRGGPITRGKELVGPPPCCDGLVEVFWGQLVSQGPGNVCLKDIGEASFSCIKGSCGDGICEDGEKHTCGCAADCPGTEP